MSNSTSIASKSSRKGSKMESLTELRSSETLTVSSSPVALTSTEDLSMYLARDSLANPSQLRVENEQEGMIGISGLQLLTPYAELSQDTASWKMYRDSFRGSTGTLKKFSKTYPRAGMMQNGKLYQHPNWEHRINVIDSGSGQLFPTPTVQDSKNDGGPSQWKRNTQPLNVVVKDSPHDGGALNPAWVEWLMGVPIGFSDLKPLEMDKYLSWQEQHGRY